MRMLALALFLGVAACQTTEANKSAPPAATDAEVAKPPPVASTAEPEGPKPRCATQDCKTKKIIDDGCVVDPKGGRLCASCVNYCPPP